MAAGGLDPWFPNSADHENCLIRVLVKVQMPRLQPLRGSIMSVSASGRQFFENPFSERQVAEQTTGLLPSKPPSILRGANPCHSTLRFTEVKGVLVSDVATLSDCHVLAFC